ncbi:MAG: hypothetical protein HUU41_05360 [Bryobacteraceae bacterium]|nr:hypothetical protein [Bryobacteraceae bacterium]
MKDREHGQLAPLTPTCGTLVMLRTVLAQPALIAANYSPYLKRFYEQVKVWREEGRRPGAQVSRHHLPNLEEQVGSQRLPGVCLAEDHEDAVGPANGNPGFWFPHRRPPDSADARMVLAGRGSLRRGKPGRAFAFHARFCKPDNRSGRLRRKSEAEQFLRLTKDENQVVVDKTS